MDTLITFDQMRVTTLLACPPPDRRSKFQRFFPKWYKAYVALSPKHAARRARRVLHDAQVWRARRRISKWLADDLDRRVFDLMAGNG